MSTLALSQSKTALAIGLTASFLATGGTPPYTYSVRANGAGGIINSSTGAYVAPAVVNGGSFGPPKQLYDTIQVQDSASAIATAQILVGTPLLLFCEIIQTQLNLANGRVYLFDQKIEEPSDNNLFIVVQVLGGKVFGNTKKFDGSGSNSNQFQYVNMLAQLQLDIQSRSTEALNRKEEVIMALASDYSQSQQEANSFFISKIPPGSQFLNLSTPDGAAIPYRFNISVAMLYTVTKTTATPDFTQFQTPQINSNA